ncbi:MAG: hypothetical protein KAS23_11265 [Anaerohalosphaera sp.]|nr:hypothetical protein [Anaerohalosphaera sp.]
MNRYILLSVTAAIFVCGVCTGQSGHITDVSVQPDNPAIQDAITMTFTGTWNDSCVPDQISVQFNDNAIFVDLYWLPLMRPCLMVVSDWKLSTTIDPLVAGEYDVYVRFRDVTEYDFYLTFDVTPVTDYWYWPPDAVIVKPASPAPGQPVSLVMEGQWPDTCIPTSMQIARLGTSILVDVKLEYEPNTGCGDAITPWRLEGLIAPLTAGNYTVYARIAENPMVPATKYAVVKEFDVTPIAMLMFFRFIPGESTVLQTGGFAGIEKIYSIEGYFGLHVNYDLGIARFVEVNAELFPYGSFLPTNSLGELFNMENLRSTSVTQEGIRFTGMTQGHDVAPVVIEADYGNVGLRLAGSITPGCCDRFNYKLNARTIQIFEPFCPIKPEMDFTGDCKVDLADLAVFARSWLQCNLIPQSACW